MSPDLPIHFSAYYYSSVSLRFYGVRGLYCWPCLRFRYRYTYINNRCKEDIYKISQTAGTEEQVLNCMLRITSWPWHAVHSNYSNACILYPLSVKKVLRISFAWLFPLTQLKCLACIMTMNTNNSPLWYMYNEHALCEQL